MTAPPTHDRDIDFAIEASRLGYGAFDAGFIVRERRGALARWLPEIGESATAAGWLFGLEAALEELREAATAPLNLPSVGLGADRVNVSIDWNAATARYVVIVAPDEGTRQLERLLIRQRRETQVLKQQAEAAADRLRISATLYRDIVEATDDAVLRLAPDLTLTFVSGPAAALIGASPEAAIGRPVTSLAPLPRLENPWRADMCADGPASFEQPIRREGAGARWLWWRVRWLGEDGGPAEFQAVGRDVTQLRRLRADLDRANEEARFAALAHERSRIAHDLHDTFVHSLVATLARLSLIRRAAPEGALKADIAEAEGEARAGLRAARQAVGALRVEPEYPEGPAAEIAAAAAALRPAIEVAIEIAPDLGAISRAGVAAMVRVAREALRNVERHSGARHVRLSLGPAPGGIRLRIDDDGVGFDPLTTPSGHFGLAGMREQARFAGGALEIGASPSGGAFVELFLPGEPERAHLLNRANSE